MTRQSAPNSAKLGGVFCPFVFVLKAGLGGGEWKSWWVNGWVEWGWVGSGASGVGVGSISVRTSIIEHRNIMLNINELTMMH